MSQNRSIRKLCIGRNLAGIKQKYLVIYIFLWFESLLVNSEYFCYLRTYCTVSKNCHVFNLTQLEET